MDDLNEFIARYVGTWNEPDAARRRTEIAAIWAEDGTHLSKTIESRGHEALQVRSADTYDKWVKSAGYVFKPKGDAVGHHNAVKFTWTMAPAAGGAPISVGLDFLLLDDDGRIRLDCQFIEPTPS